MPSNTGQAALAARDLVDAIQEVLRKSEEPLTPAKVRAALGLGAGAPSIEAVTEALHRQAAAQVLFLFPKYRSRHHRFWDRPLRDHVERLLKRILAGGPLSQTALRRRLPAYARILADNVLHEMLDQRRLHVHPTPGHRSGPAYGLWPADARSLLRGELDAMLSRWQDFGFRRAALRATALALLQEEEWESNATTGDQSAATTRELVTTS